MHGPPRTLLPRAVDASLGPDLAPPLWPPLLATRGPGMRTDEHSHHAMHLVLAVDGALRVRAGGRRWRVAAGVLTAPDVPHSIDATGAEVLVVYLDPESDAGAALANALDGPARLVSPEERDALVPGGLPGRVMRTDGVAWTHRAAALLGGAAPARRRVIHPRVRRLLELLRTLPADADTSLDALAQAVGLSPGRLMHAFTESIGVPLRPYLAWLRLQRATAAIAAGAPLAGAAAAAGFADAAHMSRTFRRMLGASPTAIRRGAADSQIVQDDRRRLRYS